MRTFSNFNTGIAFKQYRIGIFKEVFRKSIHLCSALVPTFLAFSYWPVMSLLCIVLLAIAARKRDENKFVLGPVTLVIGIICASLLWKQEAARIGVYALAFGDGFASLIGKLIGRVHIPFTNGKTAAGSLACFFAVFLSSFAVCHNCAIALLLAVIATVVEVVPMTDFDNIVIPILIGGMAQYLLF